MNRELMLDTANLEMIRKGLAVYPVSGITTNPTILKKEGDVDFFTRLKAIRKLMPAGSLHVQVTATDAEGMEREAEKIVSVLGKETFIKVPVDEQGLEAIKWMGTHGYHVTATAIYSTFQGMVAAMAGAEYLALYYNRMENIDADPAKVVRDLSSFLKGGGCNILAASFHNVRQVTEAYANGAEGCTVGPEILGLGLANASIKGALASFHNDWVSIHGEKSIDEL